MFFVTHVTFFTCDSPFWGFLLSVFGDVVNNKTLKP